MSTNAAKTQFRHQFRRLAEQLGFTNHNIGFFKKIQKHDFQNTAGMMVAVVQGYLSFYHVCLAFEGTQHFAPASPSPLSLRFIPCDMELSKSEGLWCHQMPPGSPDKQYVADGQFQGHDLGEHPHSEAHATVVESLLAARWVTRSDAVGAIQAYATAEGKHAKIDRSASGGSSVAICCATRLNGLVSSPSLRPSVYVPACRPVLSSVRLFRSLNACLTAGVSMYACLCICQPLHPSKLISNF